MTMLDGGSHASITTGHRAKAAYVYVRQSSVNQVNRHSETTDRQYGLVERAVRLGWPRDRVMGIDDDLGKSGAASDERHGFQRLIAEIGLGHAGWSSAWMPRGWHATTAIGTGCWSCAASFRR